MSSNAVAILALLFFAPLAFIYGRAVAGSIHAEARRAGRSVALTALPKLVLPAVLALCLWMRFTDPGDVVEPSGFYTGNGLVDLLVLLALQIGEIGAILFFLSVPFVMGRLFGVGSALAGRFTDVAANPLAFGVRADADPDDTPRSAAHGSVGAKGREPLVIAIDGPAASGKGTLARRLASAYGLAHLDTGLTYRAVAKALLDAGQPLDDELAAIRAAENLDLSTLDRGVLSVHAVGEAASRVAVLPLVRRSLVEAQRRFAATHRRVVLDGRDIGTTVLPGADVKLFVTASAEARAARRFAEGAGKGADAPSYEAILGDLRRRDERDSGRAVSPLRPASDARLLDTSEMDIEAAFRAACELVDELLSSRNGT